jgi:Flp pilus assembly protein TadB
MIWIGIISGGCGALFSFFYPTLVDTLLVGAVTKARFALSALLEAPPQPEDDLALAGSLISHLRAGISLDSALEGIAQQLPPPSPNRARLYRLLSGKADPDVLSTFLRGALDTGAPALAALQGIERGLQCRRKLHLKARGITGQCRAQAEVLCWLPWLLALCMALVDSAWLALALSSPLAWALWAVAAGITGAGRAWIRKLLLTALRPRSEAEKMEEEALPDFALRVLSEIAQGRDVETAIERCLLFAHPPFRDTFLNQALHEGRVARLRSILRQAASTGGPVRGDLLHFMEDHQAELEARWEERVQRLPITLLAPLFLCFFPATLLVLAGLLLPALRDAW